MPLQATSGAASYDGFGGGVAAVPQYIEEVFSTYLYTGNGSTQTITNGIDLSTKGGLVWGKSRTNAANHFWTDTARGYNKVLYSDLTNAQGTSTVTVTGFNTTGFGLGAGDIVGCNNSGQNYASWTFRKQPKFFDIVTWTGNGSYPRNISHSLGSVPACIITKATSSTTGWFTYHASLGNTSSLSLEETTAAETGTGIWGSTTPTSTVFTVNNSNVNANGVTYVAYLFASNAGGFGLTGTDNVISCGSYTGTGALQTINLGYEAQWVLIKRTDTANSWYLFDNMRGLSMTQCLALLPNGTNSDLDYGTQVGPSSIGFTVNTNAAFNASGGTYIYIAIRRGPMKVPTSGTSVFTPAIGTTDYTGPQFDATFPRVDLIWEFFTTGGGVASVDRLRGDTQRLKLDSTAAEVSSEIPLDMMYGAGDGGSVYDRAWMFGRAPSFFDEVCYTGTGSARTISHNLGVAPEMMIVKSRGTDFTNWIVYHAAMGNTYYENLNYDFAKSGPSADVWSSTNPSSSVFSTGNFNNTNGSGRTFVAYLFASCAGVSKVGSYTGTGTTQQINCGFTAGSRFVLIKRTDSDGDWYVWDSARGIVAGNDPYLLLNSTAAEVTSTDYVDTYSAGFEISSTAPAAINANGGTFIFLAIA